MKTVKRIFSFLNRALDSHPFFFILVLSVLENFIIECLSRHSITGCIRHIAAHPLIFLYNSLIILFTLSFALLFKRRVFGLAILAAPWLICGIINGVLLVFRVTPLGAIDFQVAKLSVVMMYFTPIQRILIYVGAGVFIAAIVALWIIGPKITGKINYGRRTASIVGLLVAVITATIVGQSARELGSDFGNIVGAYSDYGFVYCFSSSMLDTGINQPKDYGKERTEEILASLPATNEVTPGEKPDIIFIQLESFADPKTFKNITYSEDPAPIHTYLRKHFSHGYLEMPSLGGGTANSEFEVLTGINLDFFGAGEYPYKTIMMKKSSETLAYNLKENGYSTHAIHNHTGNFYDRDKVYPNMGFDSFQSKEYMYDYETTSYGWCKDNILVEEIVTALSYVDEENGITEDTPRFVWTVSVQGHGKYPSEPIAGSPDVIKLQSDSYTEAELCALDYYVNQIWEMDMFLGSLISVLEEREKPTILVAYGDHLPSIGLKAENLTTGSSYVTEYVTWNNMGLETKEKDLCAYELSSEIMSSLGFNNGNITKLHQLKERENTLLDEESYHEQLAYLAYDMLYGDNLQFGGESPYLRTQMRMGTIPIEMDNIKVMDNSLFVQGKGFTEKSTIFINGEKQPTTMLSRYNLMANNVEIKDGDIVNVGQTSNKREVLSYSDPIICSEEEHFEENIEE